MLLIYKVLFLLLVINYFDLCHCRGPRFKRTSWVDPFIHGSTNGTSSSAYHHVHRPIEIYRSHPVRPYLYNPPYFANWDSKNNELKEMEERELREAEEMKKRQAEAQKQREEAQRRFEQKEKAHRQYLDKLKELEEKRLERERLLVEKQREIREREMTQLRARLRAEEQKRLENEARARAEEERARKKKMEMERQKLEADKERLRKEHETEEKKIREDEERIEAEKIIIETLKKSALSVHQKRNHQKVQVIQDQSPPPAAAPVTIQKQQSQQIKVETHENTNEIRFLEILRNLNIQENQEIFDRIRMIMANYGAKRNQILRNLQEKGQVQVQVKNGNIVRPIELMRSAAVAANDKNDKKSRLVMHVYKKLNKNKKAKKKELKSQKLVEKAKNF